MAEQFKCCNIFLTSNTLNRDYSKTLGKWMTWKMFRWWSKFK